jgi:hypothetical protein
MWEEPMRKTEKHTKKTDAFAEAQPSELIRSEAEASCKLTIVVQRESCRTSVSRRELLSGHIPGMARDHFLST